MAGIKPVMLIILDGWGIREMEAGNATVLGHTPNVDEWLRTRERSIVQTSGEFVGLVPDQMGNSEVGHLNLGAGRIVYQDITRIDLAIKDGSLAKDQVLVETLRQAKQAGQKVHLLGLLGPGGVHSHQSHLHALLSIASQHGIDPVIHVITDGRDTPPTSGINFLQALENQITAVGAGRIATVSGRYYAMDRDKRWDRTQKAFDAMVKRQGETASTAQEAIKQSYDRGITDEFILPTVVGDAANLRVEPGDAIIFYNYRADRMRQIVQAFALKDFVGASYFDFVDALDIVTFTEYMDNLPVKVLFPVEQPQNTLAEWISKHGLTQYHSAETEKYPHVTFFSTDELKNPGPVRIEGLFLRRESLHMICSRK